MHTYVRSVLVQLFLSTMTGNYRRGPPELFGGLNLTPGALRTIPGLRRQSNTSESAELNWISVKPMEDRKATCQSESHEWSSSSRLSMCSSQRCRTPSGVSPRLVYDPSDLVEPDDLIELASSSPVRPLFSADLSTLSLRRRLQSTSRSTRGEFRNPHWREYSNSDLLD